MVFPDTPTFTPAISKHEWSDHLHTYYSFAQNKSQKAKPIAMIRTDFGIELRSTKMEQWLLGEGVTFEPSATLTRAKWCV